MDILTSPANLGAKYHVHLEVYEGPLDLLLRLIEREEMDITKVSLARVTDQYLTHLEVLQRARVEDLAAFLVIAAKLILIKSRALLPSTKGEDDIEEDVGDDLVEQLKEYRRYKMAAEMLRQWEERGLHAYSRLVPSPNLEPRLAPNEGELGDLVEAMWQLLQARGPEAPVDQVVSPVTVTIAQQMGLIERRLAAEGSIRFRDILRACKYRSEIVVTFLAILEMVKQRRIDVAQESLYGDILISSAPARDGGPVPAATGQEP